MRESKVGLKIDEERCFNSIFSFELRAMNSLIVRHLTKVDEAINNCDVEDEVISMFILMSYVDTHDFIELKINADDNVLFPYLPCVLLTDRKERLQLVDMYDLDFATYCAIIFIKDIRILKHVYDFIIKTKCIGSDTNTFIYYLKVVYNNLYDLVTSQIYKHLPSIVIDEINDNLFDPEFVALSELSTYNTADIFDDIVKHNGLTISTENFDKFAPLLSSFGVFGIEPLTSKVLGQLTGPVIGETVDINTIFPFNTKCDGKIVRNINWNKKQNKVEVKS